ncbi:MAG: NAD(P)-binding protein [Polyangiaceae bacterium]
MKDKKKRPPPNSTRQIRRSKSARRSVASKASNGRVTEADGVRRIAILGGGMSSLVTAFELTSIAGWEERYQITVYQQGFRLGGKGASGRNASQQFRIEEHGLHVLFGCYENAFRVLRECYAALKEDETWPQTHQFEAMFKGKDTIVMPEMAAGKLDPWLVNAPKETGEPGVGPPIDIGPLSFLALFLRWARSYAKLWSQKTLSGEVPVQKIEEALALTNPEVELDSADTLALRIEAIVERCESFLDWLAQRSPMSDDLRRAKVIIEFSLVVVVGLSRDHVLEPRIDFRLIDVDLREWLKKWRASEATIGSVLVQGLYDAVFSGHSTLCAGAILHAMGRAASYKGHIVYMMQAGMGDAVFAPLYQLLRRRGVRFEFFHRIEKLVLSDDRKRVDQILITRQVDLVGEEYMPLLEHKGLMCWPSEPNKAQIRTVLPAGTDLENWWDTWGGVGKKALKHGEDFDLVVLGLSVGVLSDVCSDLVNDPDNPRFTAMVRSIRTTQTQSAQLWLQKTSAELGWSYTPDPPISIPFQKPFDTWSDMVHLLDVEDNPSTVRGLAYLCSDLPDDETLPPPNGDVAYPARQAARARRQLNGWLDEHGVILWPGAKRNGQFDRSLIDSDYVVATAHPSDRYVLARAGSHRARLRASESGYENLFLTGDWTLTAMSIGCLEGATMGGIQTARAINPDVQVAVYDWLEKLDAALVSPRPASATRYVIRDGETLLPPPISVQMGFDAFFVPANTESLKALCREINRAPTAGGPAYVPAGPFVVFYSASIYHVTEMGNILEVDHGVWVPVVRGQMVNGQFKAEKLLLYTPYLWVTSSAALVGGRALFGFPKQFGNIKRPSEGAPALFSVETEVLKLAGGDVGQATLLEISRPDGGVYKRAAGVWQSTAELAATLGGELTDLLAAQPSPFSAEVLTSLFASGAGTPMVFLKQFPAANGKWEAVYQAIIEAPIAVTGAFQGGTVLGGYEVSALECESHHIFDKLGVRWKTRRAGPSGMYRVAPATAAFWSKFNGRVETGEVKWQA